MVSAFKTLFSDMVNIGGDASKQNKELTKQMLKVALIEIWMKNVGILILFSRISRDWPCSRCKRKLSDYILIENIGLKVLLGY